MVDATSLATSTASDKRLVYLNGMRGTYGIALWTDHTRTHFMEHLERCLVTTNANLPLEL
jgi:hypothetical protein